MTLYEISEQMKTLDKFIEDENLDREAFKEALEQIEGSLEEKVEGYIKYMKNLQGEAEIFKAEEKRMNEKRKALENHAERLKTAIDDTLKGLDIKDMKTPLFSLKYQKNREAVNVIDTNLIPVNYVVSTDIKVDKAAILQDVKNGISIPGIEISQSESLRIR